MTCTETGVLPLDPAVVRRRLAESARHSRIYDTRQRCIGLDLGALDQQVRERRRQEGAEAQRNQAFEKLGRDQENVLLQKVLANKQMRADVHADLAHYWATHQRREESTDADLKCRQNLDFITIPEDQLGPSSMQIFHGEDPLAGQRIREQRRQAERDLSAQKKENDKRDQGKLHKETLANQAMVLQDLRWCHLHDLEEESRRENRIRLGNYNQSLAAEQWQQQMERLRREEREDLEEMWHTMTSDLMTERPEASRRHVDGGNPEQVLTDRWKGMSPEQLSAIRREQEEQRRRKQREQQEKKDEEADWDFLLLESSRAREAHHRRTEAARRERRVRMDQHNKTLSREQRAQSGVPGQEAVHQQTQQRVLPAVQHLLPLTPAHPASGSARCPSGQALASLTRNKARRASERDFLLRSLGGTAPPCRVGASGPTRLG
ncbi:LOW QUALITY PROTEIN: RIB43A-like with coiled-coils protein 1 [Neosynchiropus ocellatus]